MNIERIQDALMRGGLNKPPHDNLLAAVSLEVAKIMPKIEQVAFYVPDPEFSKEYLSLLGCKDWVEDIVTAHGSVGLQGQTKASHTNVAKLFFNYDLGFELELIQYVAGNNWHRVKGRVDENGDCGDPFLSHMSYHVKSMDWECQQYQEAGLRVIQDVTTISHTNKYLLEKGRHYRYVIFDSRVQMGFDLKLIQRLES